MMPSNANALRTFRLAVQFYEIIAERHGVHDERTIVALGLVEAARAGCDAPEVYIASRCRFPAGRRMEAGGRA
jgi:hypothetical protein